MSAPVARRAFVPLVLLLVGYWVLPSAVTEAANPPLVEGLWADGGRLAWLGVGTVLIGRGLDSRRPALAVRFITAGYVILLAWSLASAWVFGAMSTVWAAATFAAFAVGYGQLVGYKLKTPELRAYVAELREARSAADAAVR